MAFSVAVQRGRNEWKYCDLILKKLYAAILGCLFIFFIFLAYSTMHVSVTVKGGQFHNF